MGKKKKVMQIMSKNFDALVLCYSVFQNLSECVLVKLARSSRLLVRLCMMMELSPINKGWTAQEFAS